MKRIGSAYLLLFLFTLTQVATGQEKMMEMKKGMMKEMMKGMVDLSDEQKAKLEKLNHEWAKKEVQLSSAIKLAKLDLHKEMDDYDTSDKDVTNLAKKFAKAKSKLITAQADHHNKKKAIFTKEQWEKKKEMENMMGMMEKKMMGMMREKMMGMMDGEMKEMKEGMMKKREMDKQ